MPLGHHGLAELVSFMPYPGLEEQAAKATPAALETALGAVDTAQRAKDDAWLLALSKPMADMGFSRAAIPNGTYNLIDKDGFHYAPFGGLKVLKTTDGNDPRGNLRVAAIKDLGQGLPEDLRRSITHIVGMGMTYDGHVVAAAGGALFLLDRDLSLMAMLPLSGEQVENSICTDERGIYVVTSKRMLKVVWTGTRLSFDEADGGWQSEYNTMSKEQATAAGALTVSGGSGTTPTLMGFGTDPDKLVVISDGDPNGTQVVAFWRDKIPEGFSQKPGTKSRRIADQIRTDIARPPLSRQPPCSVTASLFSTVPTRSPCPTSGATPSPLGSLGLRRLAFRSLSGTRQRRRSRSPGSTTRSTTPT